MLGVMFTHYGGGWGDCVGRFEGEMRNEVKKWEGLASGPFIASPDRYVVRKNCPYSSGRKACGHRPK